MVNLKTFDELLEEYRSFINKAAYQFRNFFPLEIEDFKQIGMIVLNKIVEGKYPQSPAYIKKAIKNAMYALYRQTTTKKEKILSNAKSLEEKLSENIDRELIEILCNETPTPIKEYSFVRANSLLSKLSKKEIEPPVERRKFKINWKEVDNYILAKVINDQKNTEVPELLEFLTKHAEWDLIDLYRFGLKPKDINCLIDEKILLGEKVSREDFMALLRQIRDEKYKTDKEFHERARAAWAANFFKAVEIHKKKLREDPEYRKLTLKNATKAVELHKQYWKDPDYRKKMYGICLNNLSKAHQELERKLKEDPGFKAHMTETRKNNIAKGRAIKQEKYYNDFAFRIKVINSWRRCAENARKARTLKYDSDPEFKTYLNSIFLKNIKRANEAWKMKWKIDEEFRKETLTNLRRAIETAAKKKFEKYKPRRKALLEEIIIPFFGSVNNIKMSKLIALLDQKEFLHIQKLYGPKDEAEYLWKSKYYSRIRWDIRYLRKHLSSAF